MSPLIWIQNLKLHFFNVYGFLRGNNDCDFWQPDIASYKLHLPIWKNEGKLC